MLEKDTINEIDTSSEPYMSKMSSSEIEVDQDKVEVLLQELKVESTSVSKVLSSVSLNLIEKDLFDLIKISIKVKAVYEYNWEVFRKPSEVKIFII